MAFTNVSSLFVAHVVSTNAHAPTAPVHISDDKLGAVATYVLPSLRSLRHAGSSLLLAGCEWKWEWRWMYIVYAVLVWQVGFVLHAFWWKAPVCLALVFRTSIEEAD
jgi:hypothetical protein